MAEKFFYFDDYESLMDETNRKWNSMRGGGKDSMDNLSTGRVRPEVGFEGTTDIDVLKNPINRYLDPTSLDNSIDSIKDFFATIKLGGAFEKDRFVATSQPKGVFSFDLASQGLYRPQEYYSPDLDKLIPSNSITKISSNPNQFVYTKTTPNGKKETFELIQQQEGTLCMYKKNKLIKKLISEGTPKILAQQKAEKEYPGCKLRFATSTKKVYLIRTGDLIDENEKGEEKVVDIFIPIGGLRNQTPRSLMYTTMPSLLLAYFMNFYGIKTRILGLQKGNYNGNEFIASFKIKDYDEPFDFNRIAILTADSRVFRYNLFKSVVYFYNQLGVNVNDGLGGQGSSFLPRFERYKNYYVSLIPKGKVKNKNKQLMITSNYVANPGFTDDVLMNQVKREFFLMLDAVDLEFNGAKTSLPRIKARELKLGNDVNAIRTRINGTIERATVIDDGQYKKYGQTAEEQDKIRNRRLKLRKDINETFINS
tara:strand:+ start:1576 stop:3015 length:1440 start_codon:yes stop_codon:yes gene_type:complete